MTAPAYNGCWPTIRRAVLKRDNFECQLRYPGCTHQATESDHIIGIAQGGAWWDMANLQAACKPCNVAKGNTDNPRGQPWRQPNPWTW